MSISINDAATLLSVSSESIRLLVKNHRLNVDRTTDIVMIDDGEITYLQNYLATYGHLPKITSGNLT